MKYFICKQGSRYFGVIDYDLNPLYRIANLQASAGIVIFTKNYEKKGAVFVDGRYALATNISVDKTKFEILDFQFKNVISWIKSNINKTDVISADKNCFTLSELQLLQNSLTDYKIELFDSYEYFDVKNEPNEIELYDLQESKIDLCIKWLRTTNLDAYLFCDPCFVSWLLGVRNLNEDFTKAVLAYLLITKNGKATLYTNYNSCGILNM